MVPLAQGRVIEFGAGSGHNLSLYRGEAVTQVWAVEPSDGMWAQARPPAGLRVERVAASAEAVPLASGTADTIVITWSLCTIPTPAAALSEARRLLRPGGRLLFAEHGLAPDARVAHWQRRLTPFWSAVAGGCHLDRDVPTLLAQHGFSVELSSAGYLGAATPFGFNITGLAVPR